MPSASVRAGTPRPAVAQHGRPAHHAADHQREPGQEEGRQVRERRAQRGERGPEGDGGEGVQRGGHAPELKRRDRRAMTVRRRGTTVFQFFSQGGGERRGRAVARAARGLRDAHAAAAQLPRLQQALASQPLHRSYALLVAAALGELAGAQARDGREVGDAQGPLPARLRPRGQRRPVDGAPAAVRNRRGPRLPAAAPAHDAARLAGGAACVTHSAR